MIRFLRLLRAWFGGVRKFRSDATPHHPDDARLIEQVQREAREAAHESGLLAFTVVTPGGIRTWWAEDEDHARDQHARAFPGEPVLRIEPPF